MSETPDFELRTERWCAGLRCAGARTLEPIERAFLESRARDAKRRMWIAGACAPVGALLPFALWGALPRTLGAVWLDVVCGLAILAVAAVLPTWFTMRAWNALRIRRACAADLEHGEVLRFEGTLEYGDVLDPEQRMLLELGLLIPEPGVPQQLHVLPASSTVMCRDRQRVPRMIGVTMTEVAAGPSYAMRVEVPREVAFVHGAPQVRFLRRALNDDERAELAEHIRRLRRPGMLGIVALLWVTAWLVALAVAPRDVMHYAREGWPFVVMQIAGLASFGLAYARSLRLAAGLERDTHTGWAFTLNRPAGEEPGSAIPEVSAAADDEQPGDSPRPVEFLPHSRALWSDRGRPARWRNLNRAA